MYPLKQVQLETSPLPGPEDECMGHTRHVDAEVCPVSGEYVPAEHMLQGAVPLAPLYVPAGQASHPPASDLL